jgi:ferredoxin|tara:strand:+ start:1616 stop:1939 length:324 start_codon:yes stop_codon:yes gene_type:complete
VSSIKVNIIDVNDEEHTITTSVNTELSLMDVVKNAGFSMGNCGGMALCASCHCYISNSHNTILNQKTDEEEDMLDQLHNSNLEKSRLICQIPLSEELNGVTLKIIKN